MRSRAPIPADQWEWFGTAHHYILGDRCQFHLGTRIGKVVISTVGELVIDPRAESGKPFEDVGYKRKYETMVFKLKGRRCTMEGCRCGMRQIDPTALDFIGTNTRGEAQQAHLKLCRKWAEGRTDDRP